MWGEVRHLLDRVFFLSPAAATTLFLAARIFVGFGEGPETSAAGLASDSGGSDAAVRIVESIKSVDEARARAQAVPSTETELLELLRRNGSVRFETPAEEQEFSPEEVGVIRVIRRHSSGTRPD